MRALGTLVLVAAFAWGDAAAALPRGPAPSSSPAALVDRVAIACGPFGCFRRPFWRYGDGRGFFPFRRFAPPPPRRFGYHPFGFGRFRRW